MPSSEATPYKRVLPFQFTGNGTEFFKIWIVNICLSIITLGIYSAWAKVRRLRYFYGNTSVDGKSFNYHAEPIKILKGRFVAVIFLIIYSMSWNFFPNAAMILLATGVLLFPFILVAAVSFQMRNSSYRNIRFYFERDFKGAYKVCIVPILFILILTWIGYEVSGNYIPDRFEGENGESFNRADLLPTMFFLAFLPFAPYMDFLRSKFIVLRTQYGEHKTEFVARAWDFYEIYIISIVLILGVIMIAGVLFAILSAVYIWASGGNAGLGLSTGFWAILPIVAFVYGIMIFSSGYLRAKRTNLIYGCTSFGEINIRSNLKFAPVGWIYVSNTLAIIFSLGLLIPWAQVRMARYVASATELESKDLGDIVAVQQDDKSALGEEMVDAFDLDLGL